MATFQKLVGISVLIASLSIAYYLVIFLPEKEDQKQAQAKEQVKKRNECLNKADLIYRLEWAVKCKEEGLDELCTKLPKNIAQDLGQRREWQYSNCPPYKL